MLPQGKRLSGHERQGEPPDGAYLIDDEEFLGRQYEEVFDMFPVLEEKRAQRAGDLSGGQQMMVAFGRARVDA